MIKDISAIIDNTSTEENNNKIKGSVQFMTRIFGMENIDQWTPFFIDLMKINNTWQEMKKEKVKTKKKMKIKKDWSAELQYMTDKECSKIMKEIKVTSTNSELENKHKKIRIVDQKLKKKINHGTTITLDHNTKNFLVKNAD